jgi:hypothetical protein
MILAYEHGGRFSSATEISVVSFEQFGVGALGYHMRRRFEAWELYPQLSPQFLLMKNSIIMGGGRDPTFPPLPN